MNRINGNICVGAPHSLARYRFAEHMCIDCFRKFAGNKKRYEITNATQCEICEDKHKTMVRIAKVEVYA